MHMIVLYTSISHCFTCCWKVILFSLLFIKIFHKFMNFWKLCKLSFIYFTNKLYMTYRNCHEMIFLSWIWILIENNLPIIKGLYQSILRCFRVTKWAFIFSHNSVSYPIMILFSCSYSRHIINIKVFYSLFPACSSFICWSATAQASIIGQSFPLITCGIPEKFCQIRWSVIRSWG